MTGATFDMWWRSPAAARMLGVSDPTALRIQALEQAIGAPLFYRLHHELTEGAGNRLMPGFDRDRCRERAAVHRREGH